MRLPNPIPYLFYALFSILPLIFTPITSEIFEFGKMIAVYTITLLVILSWGVVSISQKRFVRGKSILDLPILLFLISQTISTLTSIDFRTSLLGYFNRFNGGLLSIVCFAVLYFAYVTFMDKEKTKKAILLLLITASIVSIWGILEHFGFSIGCLLIRNDFSVSCWQQDVKLRVFASFGQPNWLASYLILLTPLAWSRAIYKSLSNIKFLFFFTASILLFTTLLFTKSRSGLLGLIVALVIFIVLIFKEKLSKQVKNALVITIGFYLLISIFFGTPWTSGIFTSNTQDNSSVSDGQGTESGEIRKIVWKGALGVFRLYPIFGSGVETFAYSYYNARPVEHNLVSEWDFLYNKAHNEYLNYLATTGLFGFLTYLLLIIFALIRMKVSITKSKDLDSIAILAGFISLLVTNFFGFSVVATSLLFFLFPALSHSLANNRQDFKFSFEKFSIVQKVFLGAFVICLTLPAYSLFNYIRANLIYQKASEETDPKAVQSMLTKVVEIAPLEATYTLKLAESSKNIAVSLSENGDKGEADYFAQKAAGEAETASELSPSNLTIKKTSYSIFTELSGIDSIYLLMATDEIKNAIRLAPTDAKLFYLLGISLARINQAEEAKNAFNKAIELKFDYTDARISLSMLLLEEGKRSEASLILKKIKEYDKNNKYIEAILGSIEKK